MAAAAYRSGEKLVNEWDGMTHDYTRKGGVVHTEIMLPAHAPPAFADRSTLWNSVEQIEKSSTAQLAREIEVALPVELSRTEQLALVRSFVKDNFVDAGMCADFAIHDKGTGNPHAHINLSELPYGREGACARARGRYENVFLTEDEVAELQADFPTVWQEYIERLSEYMASTGKIYKSHAATIRRWAKEDRRKGKGGISDYSCKEGESL
ncbi:MobA/MobL family protein [Acutalibacter sp. 1XD8-36]|uniref:MobA/MobL family protein n=1 Tax=Acutalibacter sp. 1XD8-36 TaxID=2320852 RepID=UPI003FA4B65F